MKHRNVLLVSAAVAALFGGTAIAQTTVPLNTGYNHNLFLPYPTVSTPISTTHDDYWLNIASYPQTTPPAVAPAFVLQAPSGGWNAPLPSSHWISARNQTASAPGIGPTTPAGYMLLRKCFCLAANFTQPSISFNARSDDTLQVWFNSQINVLLQPQFGSFNGAPLASLPSNPAWFRAGINCIYALVEDTHGGLTGFNLAGTIQANGLSSQPARGVDQVQPCECSGNRPATEADDAEVVAAIIDIAERRRVARMTGPAQQR